MQSGGQRRSIKPSAYRVLPSGVQEQQDLATGTAQRHEPCELGFLPGPLFLSLGILASLFLNAPGMAAGNEGDRDRGASTKHRPAQGAQQGIKS